jgi:pyruvate formate lyase activating enzyme
MPVKNSGLVPAGAQRGGFVHSFEVGSFVDGPGGRFVVFMTGCPLNCQYCHNPDVCRARGDRYTAEEVVARIARTADFLRAGGGGVTLTGGEPLAQPQFALDILKGAKALGLHTAIETSGYLGEKVSDELLGNLDLVLLDIKSFDPATYRDVTGGEIGPTLRFAEKLARACKPTWVRFVLVPGLTDDPANITGLARFVAGLTNVERVEVVAFHQMGRQKWEELGLPYKLADTKPPTHEELQAATALFEAEGVSVGVRHLAPCSQPTQTTEGDAR